MCEFTQLMHSYVPLKTIAHPLTTVSPDVDLPRLNLDSIISWRLEKMVLAYRDFYIVL